MMISQTVISYHFNRKIMELSPKQQAVELIRASHRVLIVAHENPDGDALGSSLSLALTLNKLKKDVTTAIAGPMPPIYNFLPNIDMVNSEVSGAKEFTVSVDIENI